MNLSTVFLKARGGNGKIICEGDTRGKAVEILVAKILWMVVGGEIRILRERDEYKAKTPDMMRDNREIIEIKRVSSETSVDNRVRDGIRQLCQEEFRDFQKVILLINENAGISEEKMRRLVWKRLYNSAKEKVLVVVIMANGKIVIIKREQAHPVQNGGPGGGLL